MKKAETAFKCGLCLCGKWVGNYLSSGQASVVHEIGRWMSIATPFLVAL